VRPVAGIQQVALVSVADGPVDMHAGTVDAGKGLLVQQAGRATVVRRGLADSHQQVLIFLEESQGSLFY